VIIDELGLQVRLVKENAIISPTSRSSEKLMHGLKVLIAKNFLDNLSEETSKGMREKAEQGHWPSYAPLGYVNNRETRVIEVDPNKAPLIAKMFEAYASGSYSLKQIVQIAGDSGLLHHRSGKRLAKSEIHRIPIYCGEFVWKGRIHAGKHTPIISKELFDTVQEVSKSSSRPRATKRSFAFSGLLTCGLCGCWMTAEEKKSRYVYYHCTGFKGQCGNTYIREDRLSNLLGEIVRAIEIPDDLAAKIGIALQESHRDIEKFHREALEKLHTQYAAVQERLDRAYDDKLAGKIDEEFWTRKSRQWQTELREIRLSMARYESATKKNYELGISILELARKAHQCTYGRTTPKDEDCLIPCYRTAPSRAEAFVPHTVSPSTSWRGKTNSRTGVPNGIRTRVAALKARCPRPTRRWGRMRKQH
jgi:site-specific DNA recombinase